MIAVVVFELCDVVMSSRLLFTLAGRGRSTLLMLDKVSPICNSMRMRTSAALHLGCVVFDRSGKPQRLANTSNVPFSSPYLVCL